VNVLPEELHRAPSSTAPANGTSSSGSSRTGAATGVVSISLCMAYGMRRVRPADRDPSADYTGTEGAPLRRSSCAGEAGAGQAAAACGIRTSGPVPPAIQGSSNMKGTPIYPPDLGLGRPRPAEPKKLRAAGKAKPDPNRATRPRRPALPYTHSRRPR
jgi:hypothetical protein